MWAIEDATLRDASAAQLKLLDVRRHAWVSAHAGTGKTETLTRRVAALLLADDTLSPRDILALTYTRAAAGEMAVRIPARVAEWVALEDGEKRQLLADILGRAATDADMARLAELPKVLREAPLWVTTIHGLCSEILARFPIEAGVKPGFEVLTEAAQARLLEEAQRDVLRRPGDGVQAAVDALVGAIGDPGVRGLVGLVCKDWDKLSSVLRHAADEGGIGEVLARAAGGMTETRVLDICPESVATLRAWVAALRADGSSRNGDLADYVETALANPQDWEAWERVFWSGDKEKLLAATAAVREVLAQGLDAQIAAVRAEILAWRTHNRTAEGYTLTWALVVWVRVIGQAYDDAKKAANALDFGDMIRRTMRLVAGWDATFRAWVMEQLDRDIRHILLDEGQDNSHMQNEILQALAGELVKAGGSRTLMAVGDVKQSIYRFQGAAPARFVALRDWLQREAPGGVVVGGLAHSFRSAGAVLRVADNVAERVVGEAVAHMRTRPNEGWCVRRPMLLLEREQAAREHHWLMAEERQNMAGRMMVLGQAVADEIAALVGHVTLASRGTKARFGDVMVLVKRKDTGAQIAGVLAERGIPVTLGWQGGNLPLMVRDVLALASVLVAPTDRAKLGQVLVSPFVGWEQARVAAWLFEGVALGDEVEAWLVRQREIVLNDGVLGWLGQLEREDLLAAWAGGMDGCLGEVTAWWQALLASAVGAESVHAWVESVTQEGLPGMVPCDEDAVRICTVWGAKGLEAPVVILPETTFALDAIHMDEKLLWDEGAQGPVGLWFRQGSKLGEPAYQARLRAAEEEAVRGDNARLLYVAVTRAKEGLIVLGSKTGKDDKRAELETGDHWYGQLAAAGVEVQTLAEVPPVVREAEEARPVATADLVWDGEVVAARVASTEQAFGVAVHAALQGDWRVTDDAARTQAEAVKAALPELFDGVLHHELEVAVDGKLRRIDLLVEKGDALWVVDFKTDAKVPETADAVRADYVAQVQAYVAAAAASHPGKAVRGAVVYTAAARLLWVA